jgi:hypothetical protein
MPKTIPAEAYIPGVCNINRHEIAQRRKIGYIGTALLCVLLAVMLGLGLSRWYRVLLFFPASLAATGFLQAKNHFCVGYAAAGQQNATEGSTKATTIADTVAVAADKKRARKMNIQSFSFGLLVVVVSFIIPVFHP